MAGVKGKSGGSRPNSGGARANSGGKRAGAGRKPKAKSAANPATPAPTPAVTETLEPQAHGGALKRTTATPVEVGDLDMLQLLQSVALGRVNATNLQVRAAIAAVQYTHTKRHDGGKKDEMAEKARQAAAGRFGRRPPPLKLVNGGEQ